MEMIEPTDPYEQGFIDGMAKQRDSAVQRFVEGGTPDSELAEHKRIIREQQAEIEKLGSELDRIVELYTDKAIENEALKKARCVACGWNPNLIGGEKIACNKCNDTGWVCEWHPDKEAHMCCGGAGMPCECTKGEA